MEEVISRSLLSTAKNVLDVSPDAEIEEWLSKAVVCYYKKGVDVKQSMKEMYSLGVGDLIFSKFDSKSSIISKRDGTLNVPLEKESIETLKRCFAKVTPWNKDIKMIVKRRFEIVGLPIHLWSDENIMKIGACMGEVAEIHFTKQSFDVVELSIFININDISYLQKVITLKE